MEKILRNLYYAFSPKMRLNIRKLVYAPIDAFEILTNKRNKNVPKKGDIFIGSGDFIGQGIHQVQLLTEFSNLKADSKVLDVGSGIGRTAVALKTFLSDEGTYNGFDVVEKGVLWCQNNISASHNNFAFKYVPLSNDLYSLTKEKADVFTFPYENASFDTVFLFSVFTHMQLLEVQNYLNEIQRVLKVGGECLATFFIYNEKEEVTIADKNYKFPFPYKKQGFRLMNEKVPSANIAFSEEKLREMAKVSNLSVVKKVNGTWKDTPENESLRDFQDVIVFRKN